MIEREQEIIKKTKKIWQMVAVIQMRSDETSVNYGRNWKWKGNYGNVVTECMQI